MSVFTDLDTVRKHLQAFDFDTMKVHFQPVVLTGSEWIQLPHNALAFGTLNVYTHFSNTPAGPVAFLFSGTSWIDTGYPAILPDSVVVAEDDLPRERYTEGVDYAVDYAAGRLKRFQSGSISDGGTGYLWLIPLGLAVLGVDYEADEDQGTVRRLAGGSLPDPVNVLVSYETSPARASESLLLQAIDEAEAKILARLKPEYDNTSTDSGLKIGATELALAIICDDLAGGVLTSSRASSADGRARRFMELALRYEQRALHDLTPFLRMPPPAVSKRQQNLHPSDRSW